MSDTTNPTTAPAPQYIRIKDLLAMSGLSESTIYRAMRSGDLKAYKRGNATLINKADAMAYIENKPWTPITGYKV